MKRAKITVSGDVQGVGFRAHTQATARALGVNGYVRNLKEGDVEIVVEGDDAAVERLIAWSRSGPRMARVDDVRVEYSETTGEFRGFDVRL